jgi:hypothetical protein
MAGRQAHPKQGKNFAAGAAIVFLVAWHANPATASSNTPVLCDDVADSALEIPAHKLQATIVNHESDAKRVEENAAKSLDDEKAVETAVTENPIAAGKKVPAMHARVPGVSDDELARYKRRMYRTDI